MRPHIPEATENALCPLCGGSDGNVVGRKGRFGMVVQNLCCATCATVYVTPRPSREDMAEYYRTSYRQHYADVGYCLPDGRRVRPGDSGFEQELERWHQSQARTALTLCETPPGSRVLEIGCRHGRTLAIMREQRSIVPFGIEPGEAEAEQARESGVECFTGTLDDYEPGEQRFDQAQCFHVLEHVHDPLGALLKLRSLLAPQGKLLVEVPNVYQPYGLLEENFFQNVHLVSYSPNTLTALLARAGFEVTRVVAAASLFAVARPRAALDPSALPLPFAPELLPAPEQTSAWVAKRLHSYALVEKVCLAYEQRGGSPELCAVLAQAFEGPAFTEHLVNRCAGIVERLIASADLETALRVVLSVANGDHPPELRREFRNFAERMGAPPEALATSAE